MTTSEGKPPKATRGLRDMVTNLKIESAQLAKSKTAVGQAGGTWLSRVAREVEALLPAIESRLGEQQARKPDLVGGKHDEGIYVDPDDAPAAPQRSELGNLKTARDLAYRIFAEITVIPADAQEAKVIALISQAAAQARVDELRVLRASLVEHGDWHEYMIGCGCKFCKDERDLAAIASATKS